VDDKLRLLLINILLVAGVFSGVWWLILLCEAALVIEALAVLWAVTPVRGTSAPLPPATWQWLLEEEEEDDANRHCG